MSRRSSKKNFNRIGLPPDCLPKLCGGDVELGNFIQGHPYPGGSGGEASLALLREIQGISHSGTHQSGYSSYSASNPGTGYTPYYGSGHSGGAYAPYSDYSSDDGWRSSGSAGGWWSSYNPQDYGRKYLPENGGCVYIDMKHLELCLPEVRDAFDHVAAWHAMLAIALRALHSANEKLSAGQKIQAMVNNSDGQGHTYGSHMNFLTTRRCWDNFFHHKIHYMLYFASYLASSIVFTGAGKVASENGRPQVDYQISQRADFFETLQGVQTTFNRPIVNCRDESLCGSSSYGIGSDAAARHMARLHVIFFDNTLCHTACLLKIGVTQIILAMIEQEHMVPGHILDNPLKALLTWSHDPSLEVKARVLSGKRYTAVELQMAILDCARRFVASGRAEGIVPRAEEILHIWGETLEELKNKDFVALTGKLDWVLKQTILQDTMEQKNFDWRSPEIKHLDLMYSGLDPAEGLYWAFEKADIVQTVVSKAQIEAFVKGPPVDTRAWLRSQILQRVPEESIVGVDWDEIRFKFPATERTSSWTRNAYFTLPMGNPLRFSREECLHLFQEGETVKDALQRMGMVKTDWSGKPVAEANRG